VFLMSTVVGGPAEDRYVKDRERVLEAYDALLNRVKELETEKAVLKERLRGNETQQQELEKKLSAAVTLIRSPPEDQAEIDAECLSEMKELRSSISRLLTPRETPGDKGAVDIKELRSSLSRLLTPGDVTP
jgi:predicted  nucleic acid-binding Zn-ribbon protein